MNIKINHITITKDLFGYVYRFYISKSDYSKWNKPGFIFQDSIGKYPSNIGVIMESR